MGHLRTGSLPRTHHWSAIVSTIAQASGIADLDVQSIAAQTLFAGRSGLPRLSDDLVLQRCFQFLVALAVSGGCPDPETAARELGLQIDEEPGKLPLSRALRSWISSVETWADPEFLVLSRQATVDTIVSWVNAHPPPQPQLICLADPFFPWRAASSGRGFCRLSRLFFSKFTERYLEYFLSRVTADLLSVEEQELFEDALGSQVHLVSQYAFETSKLLESFSAGWFNKNAVTRVPTAREVGGFLAHGLVRPSRHPGTMCGRLAT